MPRSVCLRVPWAPSPPQNHLVNDSRCKTEHSVGTRRKINLLLIYVCVCDRWSYNLHGGNWASGNAHNRRFPSCHSVISLTFYNDDNETLFLKHSSIYQRFSTYKGRKSRELNKYKEEHFKNKVKFLLWSLHHLGPICFFLLCLPLLTSFTFLPLYLTTHSMMCMCVSLFHFTIRYKNSAVAAKTCLSYDR